MALSTSAPRGRSGVAHVHLDSIPLRWRLSAVGVLLVLLLGAVGLTVARWQSPAAAVPAPAAVANTTATDIAVVSPPVAAPAPLTAGQLQSALTRTLAAPGAVTIELTYAPPVFFQATGQAAPPAGSLAFFMQENTHIDALDPVPAHFSLTIDGQGQYPATQGTILSDSGHHRVTSFVVSQADLPVPQHNLAAVFTYPNGKTATASWDLPLQLPNGTTATASGQAEPAASVPAPAPVAAAVQDDASASVDLTSLNSTLRRSQKNVTYAGVQVAQVDAVFATPEYFQSTLSPEATARFAPDQHGVFLISETSHTADLPADPPPLTLRYQGTTYTPSLVEPTVTSAHHRVLLVQFPVNPNQARLLGSMELDLPDGSSLTWGLPIVYQGSGASGLGLTGASILALVGGMIAAMWPCLFQLTVFFIPALAGVSMEEQASGAVGFGSRFRVLRAALWFILGFTIIYTAAGALIGFAVQEFGNAPNFSQWQGYIGIVAGIAIILLALRTAAKVRAPIVCKMPVLSKMAQGRRASSPIELMFAGLAFATGCMTCFGAALIIAMVVYVGMAGSALIGGLTLFLFSMGMGIPLVLAAMAMAKVLPTLTRLERITPWLGLASSVIMIGFGIMLITGNYMAFTTWIMQRV